ncbi:helix-turn-helix transcriptional regulator [Pseudomonas sp. TH34]|uniref:helix-turn-helix transcriptional regulator n=1 Tax=Pseudomonas sp. TH34 TaxID=2796399 RepID=UPI001912856B|nr:helix-turn-helix transcriptional regulator [Pseudomonas sp. TH34]MBK5411078.1 helix-turn-helix transcriptional regulator [Pseudomonas sp. TH34]
MEIPMVEWLFSGIGATLVSDWLKERRSRKQNLPCSQNTPALVLTDSSYALSIGEKVRFIRTELLNLSLRQLSEILEIEKVSNLESYELGVEEFPLLVLKKFESYFSINPGYLDGVSEGVFSSFHLCKFEVERYLSQGYEPIILCSPNDRSELFCRVAFKKNDGTFLKVVVGDLLCSFASSGGGQLNIQILIHALLERGASYKDVRVLKVTSRAWELMRRGTYYNQEDFHRSADWECQDVFIKWFKDSEESNKLWNFRSLGK